MEAKKTILWSFMIIGLGLGLLLGGCAQINPSDEDQGGSAVTSPTEPPPSIDGRFGGMLAGKSNDMPPPCDLTRHVYPTSADLPPDGYVFVDLGADNTPSGDDWVKTYIWRDKGGQLWLDESGIVIQPFGVPYSTWIAMTKPLPNEPWVEFEPHGLYFTWPQYARISYAGCQLPGDIEPEELEIWYWNEELGKFEYIGGRNNLDEEYIEFDIEHFSRYVVAGQQ